MAKKEAKLYSIKIRCPKLDKLVNVPVKDTFWTGYGCCCGSGNDVKLTVTKCKCGKEHKYMEVDGY